MNRAQIWVGVSNGFVTTHTAAVPGEFQLLAGRPEMT